MVYLTSFHSFVCVHGPSNPSLPQPPPCPAPAGLSASAPSAPRFSAPSRLPPSAAPPSPILRLFLSISFSLARPLPRSFSPCSLAPPPSLPLSRSWSRSPSPSGSLQLSRCLFLSTHVLAKGVAPAAGIGSHPHILRGCRGRRGWGGATRKEGERFSVTNSPNTTIFKKNVKLAEGETRVSAPACKKQKWSDMEREC
jgi:hypothetical protein